MNGDLRVVRIIWFAMVVTIAVYGAILMTLQSGWPQERGPVDELFRLGSGGARPRMRGRR
jgi:hypothetical protein